MTKIAQTTKKLFTVKKINKTRLKKGRYYKFIIVAIDASDKVVSTSKIVHAVTNGDKYVNCTAVTTKADDDDNIVELDVGKKYKLKGK